MSANIAHAASLRVLLAEDSETNRSLFQLFLSPTDHKLDCVNNGREVLELLETKIYDVILLDLQMPVMDGWNCAKQVVERFPDSLTRPKLIAISVDFNFRGGSQFDKTYFDGYLPKPVYAPDLVELLDNLSIHSGL